MNEVLEIILLEFEQPSEQTWQEIGAFVKDWNTSHDHQFHTDQMGEFVIYFDNPDDPEIAMLRTSLEEKHRTDGWIHIASLAQDLSAADIESHDFIQIIGDGYPEEFILNMETAFDGNEQCLECGTQHPHLQIQLQSVQINEAYLDANNEVNARHEPKGLDVINLPNGGLLISTEVAGLLDQMGELPGYSLVQVFNERNEVSEKVYQLMVTPSVLIPANSEQQGAICPSCGTVLSTFTGVFGVSEAQLGGSRFFARHPSGMSSIYVAREVYNLWKSAQCRGLTPVQGVSMV
ncbi:MAG: hypothetical protein AAF466_02215 [Bacteroidota bacterium]